VAYKLPGNGHLHSTPKTAGLSTDSRQLPSGLVFDVQLWNELEAEISDVYHQEACRPSKKKKM
jgi:hypothetical protein